jgi:hypothetical protein
MRVARAQGPPGTGPDGTWHPDPGPAGTDGSGPSASAPPRTGPARAVSRVAIGFITASAALLVAVGLLGPSAAVPRFPSAPPWPSYFTGARPGEATVTILAWLAVGLGGTGLAAGLLAARRGWRPRSRTLLAASLLAVITLVVVPPVGSTDMLDYASYGRISVLGHSPYRMTPAMLAATGDPVGAVAPHTWRRVPSVYGPLATASEAAASALAGPSPARTVFWLKVWNGLAYLAVALALDRLLRRDPGARVRAHLLWTVNPLMLFAVLAGGHIDGLAAAAGFLGLACLRRPGAVRGLAAGMLAGAAIAIKAPFLLYLPGLAWAARRSPRTLAAAAVGAAAVIGPSYAAAGRAAVTAVVGRGTGPPDLYQPWQLLTRALTVPQGARFDDLAGLAAAVIFAAVLLARLPAVRPGLPAVTPALALSLAWLTWSPQQRPWFDAMVFPLVALLPATRLDWVVAARALAGALAELPGVTFYTQLRPPWLSAAGDLISRGLAPAALVAAAAVLAWCCVTRRWTPSGPLPCAPAT